MMHSKILTAKDNMINNKNKPPPPSQHLEKGDYTDYETKSI